MTNHFDIVSVRAYDECRVVFPAVIGAQTRRAIVLRARLQRSLMERIDLLAVLGDERQMKACRLLIGRADSNRPMLESIDAG